MTKRVRAGDWFLAAVVVAALAIAMSGCGSKATTNSESANSRAAATNSDSAAAEGGVEKAKPAPGTGNVQGKVFYNSKPAANIEIRLCETFSRYLSGCGGQIYNVRTDGNGEYLFTNVAPKTYEALTARVFDTDSYVFATSGIAGISAAKYEVAADKTFFVTPINLFKSDLKIVSPKAGAKVSGQGLELKWDSYSDAAYYKFSIYPDDSSITSPYVNERIEATSVVLDKPLEKGTYRWQVSVYNKDDRKLSESADDIKFTVN